MDTVLAFVLTLTMGGEPYSLGNGLAAFQDIYRCEEFARAVEKSANSTYVGGRLYYEKRSDLTEAKCLPQFVPVNTRFWD